MYSCENTDRGNMGHMERWLKDFTRKIVNNSYLVSTKYPVYPNGNKVINSPRFDNAKIKFKGKNNILYFEGENTILSNCKISFNGDNSVVYISAHSSKSRKLHTNIFIQSDSAIYIGRDTNFHQSNAHRIDFSVSETKNIIIGNDCLFSMDVWLRTSDGHAIYDGNSKKRINHGKSILIGDHVWIGQNVSILKGATVGSGSIIGAGSIVSGKRYASNSLLAGTPAKVLKKNVFFNKPDVNSISSNQLKAIEQCNTDEWIFNHDSSALDIGTIDKKLSRAKTSGDKLLYIQKTLVQNSQKNRFSIEVES